MVSLTAYFAISEYVVGDWFIARTIDEMQEFYLSRLPAIRDAAKAHGYAIAVHGSTRRDFDLMAMQWREGASDRDTLAHAIAKAACGITRAGPYIWTQKPMGRVATSICICWTDHANPDFKGQRGIGHIDLSVLDLDRLGQDTVTDAARYRWLRQQSWNSSKLFVVRGSKHQVQLGTDCPRLERLDAFVDEGREERS